MLKTDFIFFYSLVEIKILPIDIDVDIYHNGFKIQFCLLNFK